MCLDWTRNEKTISQPHAAVFFYFILYSSRMLYIRRIIPRSFFTRDRDDRSMYAAALCRAEYITRRRASAASHLMNTLSSKTPHHAAIE